MKILIVSGSSGGHIFPALALMEALEGRGHGLHLVLPKNNSGNINLEECRVSYIHGANVSFKLNLKNVKNAVYFLLGAWESLKIVIKFKPDVVVGFGSLNTLAPVFFGWFFRIKTLIHEQNVIPGRANRLLSKLVDKVALSFEETKEYLNISPSKLAFTGNPLRKEMIRIERKEALDFLKLDENKFNILITGGSQGSEKINSVSFEAISSLERKESLQVIHITGSSDLNFLNERYKKAGFAYRIFSFFSNMQYAYSAADLIICRAGATTIAELARFEIPAILIPYPFAQQHQQANARILAEKNAALIIDDKDLTVDKLSGILNGLISSPEKIKAMKLNYQGFKCPDAAALLADEILKT